MKEALRCLKDNLKYYQDLQAGETKKLLEMTGSIIGAKRLVADSKKKIQDYEKALEWLEKVEEDEGRK